MLGKKTIGFLLFAGAAVVATSAFALANTSDALVLAIRLHPVAGGEYVRVELDKDLNCGARLTGSERRRAYVLAPTHSDPVANKAASQDDLNRIQNLATSA